MTLHPIAKITAAAALAGFALLAHARDLTIVSWGGAYQDGQKEVFFKPFNATGTKLIDESWDGGLGVLRTKIKGGNNNWDVVQVEADELEIGCDEGLYEKLDVAKIGGAARYLPGTVHPCGVGAIIYNLVLAYDGDKVKTAPAGWADFFDTKKFPGKRSIRNGAKWNLEIALIADGVPAKDVYKVLRTPEGVDRAFRKLDTIKPDLVFWKSGAQPPQMLAAGDVVFTTAYNGRITAAKAAPLVDKSLTAELPTNPAILKQAFAENPKFWIDNGDKLAERWTKWAGTK